jgi:NitT/TauT family transport system substrate-binding protein
MGTLRCFDLDDIENSRPGRSGREAGMTYITHRSIARATLLAAGLFASSPHALAQQPSPMPWRHAIIEPKGDAGFQVMAMRAGFVAKEGVKLELTNFQNDVIALRALFAGEIDSYEGGTATAMMAAARNADLKIIGCHWQTVVHSVFARAEFKGPNDLKGNTVAISAPNATPDLIARAYLAQNNVPVTEVKFASLGNDPDRFKAMLAKLALATVISIEFVPIAEPAGIKLVARGSDVMPNYLRLCTVTTGKLLGARREDAIRFLAAQMQGYRHALAHPDEEIRITREITGMKPEDPRPEFIFKEAARHGTGIDPTMPIPMHKLEWLQGELLKIGALAQPMDLRRLVDTDVRAQALARAGMQQ